MKEIRIVSEEDNDWYIDTEIRDLNGRNVIITNADGFCNCDIIIWDGGNNDFPFYTSDLHITVTDPHRAGHGMNYYPGEVNLRMSDAVIINKIDSSNLEDIANIS